MILDVVVCAARKALGNLRPLVAQLLVGLRHYNLLLFGPLLLVNGRIQVVVPPFSALLAAPARNGKLLDNVLGNDAPALDAELGHQMPNRLVLLGNTDAPDSVGV